jgi:hypothetical protein
VVQVSGLRHGSLGNIKSQHEKFPMDARRSLGWVLRHHAQDQFPHLLGNLLSPNWPPHFGNKLPIQLEASSMPPNHRFGDDCNKRLFPLGPEPSRQHPEELIEDCLSRSGMPSFQSRELLTKNEVFKKQRTPVAEQTENRAK